MPPKPDRLWQSLSASSRLFLIAGPCVIENEALCLRLAASLAKTCSCLRIPFVFKASFDKANRSWGRSFRGPCLEEGLRVPALLAQLVKLRSVLA